MLNFDDYLNIFRMLAKPNYLKEGEKVGIISPARKIDPRKVEMAENILRKAGLEVMLGKNALGKYHQYSGTHSERAADFQYMLDHPEIKAILCSGGGYGSVYLLGNLDFTEFRKHPKWIAGYSDITIFHNLLYQQFNFCSLHSTMPVDFSDEHDALFSQNSLLTAIFGQLSEINFEHSPLNRIGVAEGELVGGNLSILYSMLGTPYEPDFTNRILFIEDVGEYLYQLDRMMMSLKLAGKFNMLKGLIVGSMTEMEDNEVPFGMDAYSIVHEHVKDYNFPVAFNFPAGHQAVNQAFYLGRRIRFEVNAGASGIKYQ